MKPKKNEWIKLVWTVNNWVQPGLITLYTFLDIILVGGSVWTEYDVIVML